MMDALRRIRFRFVTLFRRKQFEAEMAEEMRSHLAFEAAARREQGLDEAEAWSGARRAFGGFEQNKERCRDEARFVFLEQLVADVRYAARALAKSPSFTITAVLTLALGIGVNAALFSVVNMVALRPLPVKDPDSLVKISGRDARGRPQSAFSYTEYLRYRQEAGALESVIAFTTARWSFESETAAQPDPERDDRGPGRVPVAFVSDNYFDVLGGPIQIGRGFRPEEMRPGASPVIVLSNLFWETRFNRDPDVIGRAFTMDQKRVTVIGVAAPEFSGHEAVPPAGWLPLPTWSNRADDYGPTGPQDFGVIGRLKAGMNEEMAKADLDVIAARLASEFPGERAKSSVRLERGLRFLNLMRTAQGSRFVSLVVFGFGLVLVIACTNVTNLLLARGVARQSEIGIRLTLGADRLRIVRQLFTENVLLCFLGAVLGLGLATWTLQLLLPVVVSRLPTDWGFETRHLPFFDTVPDRRVLGFTALLTLGATLVVGMLPAWHASGANLIAAVRNEGTAFGRRLTASGLRKLLVIVQVAIALTLLSCAGVLVRNLVSRQKADVGYDAHAVFGVTLTPERMVQDWGQKFRQALETLRTVPGVAAVGVASPAPLQGQRGTQIRAASDPTGSPTRYALTSQVSDGFFDTFRIPLLRGRAFAPSELHSGVQAVVVSEALARDLWPGQDALGRTFSEQVSGDVFRECEVVGVARDIMMQPFHDERRVVYHPAQLDVWRGAALFVRPREASAPALAEIVRAARSAGFDLQFERRYSFLVEYFLLPSYAFAVASAALGALALGMASVGLYGLMTFSVNQRVREIGIRMALGAAGGKVVTLFLRQGLRLVAVGLVLGLIGGSIFTVALGKMLYGFIEPFDPVAFGAVTLLFILIALLACWLPARRATNVDPMVALRAE